MKKILVTLILLVGFTTMAQHRDHHKGKKMAMMKMMDMTPEQMATLQTKKMVLTLELSKKQQEQVQTLNLENAKLRKAKIEEWKAKKENGEMKKPTSEEHYAIQNARLDHQIAQQEKMKNILNDEQYAKWKNMRHKKGVHAQKKMHKKTK